MNKNRASILAIGVLLLLQACGPSPRESKEFSLSLPSFSQEELEKLPSFPKRNKTINDSDGEGPNWGMDDPTSAAQMRCFGFFVNHLNGTSGIKCDHDQGFIRANTYKGLVKNGRSLSFKVPLQSKIVRAHLVAFRLNPTINECPNIVGRDIDEIAHTLSAPFILGSKDIVVANHPTGSAFPFQANFSTDKKIGECEGMDNFRSRCLESISSVPTMKNIACLLSSPAASGFPILLDNMENDHKYLVKTTSNNFSTLIVNNVSTVSNTFTYSFLTKDINGTTEASSGGHAQNNTYIDLDGTATSTASSTAADVVFQQLGGQYFLRINDDDNISMMRLRPTTLNNPEVPSKLRFYRGANFKTNPIDTSFGNLTQLRNDDVLTAGTCYAVQLAPTDPFARRRQAQDNYTVQVEANKPTICFYSDTNCSTNKGLKHTTCSNSFSDTLSGNTAGLTFYMETTSNQASLPYIISVKNTGDLEGSSHTFQLN